MTDQQLEDRVREVAPNGVYRRHEGEPWQVAPIDLHADRWDEWLFLDLPAIIEAIRQERCGNCNGVGDIWSPVAPVECGTCRGSGLLPPQEPELRKVIFCDETTD